MISHWYEHAFADPHWFDVHWVGFAGIVVPSVPGLEYTLQHRKTHSTLDFRKMHHTLPIRKLHYTVRDR